MFEFKNKIIFNLLFKIKIILSSMNKQPFIEEYNHFVE